MHTEYHKTGWMTWVDESINLEDPATYIRENYLKDYPIVELIEVGEMFEIENSDRIVEWHNDSRYGMNVTFLVYVDEQFPETGGSISLRNHVTNEQVQIYPKAYQVVMMSQAEHIEHRAEYSTIRRHMFNIDFNVLGL